MLTISGAHKDLEGAEDGAVEGPAQEGDGAGARPLQREAQPIVLVLQIAMLPVSRCSQADSGSFSDEEDGEHIWH